MGPSLDANRLRALAESAYGLRDGALALVFRDEKYQLVPLETATAAETLLELETKDAFPRMRVPSVTITPPRSSPMEIAVKCDSLFWTESAVQKFFFPYYQRLLPHDTMEQLWKSFMDPHSTPRIYAFAHIPPTQWVEITDLASSVGILGAASPGQPAEFLTLREWLSRYAT